MLKLRPSTRPFETGYDDTYLHSRLATLAEGVIECYLGDIGHDALTLSFCQPGDILLWSVRKSGTFLWNLSDPANDDVSTRIVIESRWAEMQGAGGISFVKAAVIQVERVASNRLAYGRVSLLRRSDDILSKFETETEAA